ncbi:MAG: CHAT domain-containing protein [Acidobacteria bacterium]|nr:CHAT domain-containing protein [Acidobacteriota bacterium]
MVLRAAALALLLLASPAWAGDACEGLRERAPRDPHSCECFRGPMVSRETFRALEQRLGGWLDETPEDPWLLAALGGLVVERDAVRARPLLEQALGSFVAARQAAGEAYVRLLLARDFQRRRRVPDLRREMAAAEALTKVADHPVLTAWLARLEAGELGLQSLHEEALFVARRATLLEPFESLPPSLRYGLLGQAATSARLSGRPSEALVFARRAGETCGPSAACRSEVAYEVSVITGVLARAGLATRADAEQRTREAYVAAEALGESSAWAAIHSLCALGEWVQPPESSEWNRLCQERALALGCLDLHLDALLRSASAMDVSDPAEVQRAVRRLEDKAREHRRLPLVGDPDPADILHTVSRLHERSGQRDAAIAALSEAIDFREKLRDRQTDAESRASILSRSAPLYYELAASLAFGPGNDIARAFATIEALRARSLLDDLARASGVSPAPGGADADDLSRTVLEIAAAQSLLADAALPEAERDAALRQLDRLEARETELAARVARANPGWAEARRPRLAELAEVRGLLGHDEALVLFQLPPPGTSNAWSLVITSAGEHVVQLEDSEIGAVLALYLGTIERRTAAPAEMTAAIERAFVSPVIDALPRAVRKLVIVPDGPIARLPIAALPDPRTGRPLVETFDLSLAPSATAWLALRGSPTDRLAPAALGLGDVTRGRPGTSDVERSYGLTVEQFALPRSRSEVRAVIEAVGGASRALYSAGASEAAIKRLDLVPFGVVHFATHAVVNTARPSRSAILLAPGDAREDGLLQPREIAALDFSRKLVFLSACSSAAGRELRGEGPLSLARVFLGAGARAVIGTVWPVQDAEATALAGRFYDRLARGETASAALATAQRELLAAGTPPAAWAGFIVIGDGDAALAARAQAEPVASWGRIAAITGLAGLAVVLAWLYLRRR